MKRFVKRKIHKIILIMACAALLFGVHLGYSIITSSLAVDGIVKVKEVEIGEYIIQDDGYNPGDEIEYTSLNWKVISVNDDTITLILSENYVEAAYDTKNKTPFETATCFNILNTNFINDYPEVQNAITSGAILKVTDKDYYIRLPELSELSENISNDSNTPFWTQTSNNSTLYFGSSNGTSGTVYAQTGCGTYYSGYGFDNSSGISSVTKNLCTGVKTSSTSIAPKSTKVNYSYRSGGTYASGSYSRDCSNSVQRNLCHASVGPMYGGNFGSGTCYYLSNKDSCARVTYYNLVSGNLGLRPVITVKKV